MSKTKKTMNDKASGNTKTDAKDVKNDMETRMWFFTWNNYNKDSISSLLKWFHKRNILYVFQEEKGESGTPHLQGCFKSKNPIKFKTLKKLYNEVHWEKCKMWDQATEYCSKDKTRIGKIYTNIELPEKLEHGFDMELATQWQLDIIALMSGDLHNPPDKRLIFWIYDKEGGKGKTTLAKYLVDTFPNKVLFLGGKATDIKYGVVEFLKNKNNRLKMAIFGFPRTQEDYVSYQALEEIKDGIFFSSKYESGMVRYNIPHVIVLANFEPNYEALSEDRWEVIAI